VDEEMKEMGEEVALECRMMGGTPESARQIIEARFPMRLSYPSTSPILRRLDDLRRQAHAVGQKGREKGCKKGEFLAINPTSRPNYSIRTLILRN
jgi:hypothetical protein